VALSTDESAATRVQPSIQKTTEKIMPARSIDSPRASELPAALSAAPARPASEDSGQRSRVIIPGDDPGDQQPPKSIPVPVIHVDIDRSKANELGISMRSIGDTLALLVGEYYVNRFNRVGRSYEVIQQVPLTPETLTRYYVNSAAGQPVPLSNLVTLKTATEPECGLKICGIAVGLLILMATVALLSMQMARTVDG
jgi:multidrug efflux pump subunit AcrB